MSSSITTPSAPEEALRVLAGELREEGPEVAGRVVDPVAEPVLGELVAAGPRCVHAGAEYAVVIESIREGFLLHYGEPRLLRSDDPDLCLLVGDHLYARGIERLVHLQDLLAVHELSDLISLSAQLDAAAEDTTGAAGALWVATCVAIAVAERIARERQGRPARVGRPEPLLRARPPRRRGCATRSVARSRQ